MVHRQLIRGLYVAAVHATIAIPREYPITIQMPSPLNPRRAMIGLAKRYLLARPSDQPGAQVNDDPPRLTLKALEKISMSRSRERILANVDDLYREAFDRAKASGDQSQMASLDFAYRREQLYFEILLDIRDSFGRAGNRE